MKSKRLLAVILLTTLLFILLPHGIASAASDGNITATTLTQANNWLTNADNNGYTLTLGAGVTGNVVIGSQVSNITLSTNGAELKNTYITLAARTNPLNITFSRLVITAPNNQAAFLVSDNANVTVNLAGESTMKGGSNGAGVAVQAKNDKTKTGTLRITSSTQGKLTAVGGSGILTGGAGIGTNYASNVDHFLGFLTIDGNAFIDAQGGDQSAGIGGGYYDYSPVDDKGTPDDKSDDVEYGGITIGGTANVTANGGRMGPGIGGGRSGGHIRTEITDHAKVNATGGMGGAGIGGGVSCPGGYLTIEKNADVTAQGGASGTFTMYIVVSYKIGPGAGVGSGGNMDVSVGSDSRVKYPAEFIMTGGNLTAKSGGGSAYEVGPGGNYDGTKALDPTYGEMFCLTVISGGSLTNGNGAHPTMNVDPFDMYWPRWDGYRTYPVKETGLTPNTEYTRTTNYVIPWDQDHKHDLNHTWKAKSDASGNLYYYSRNPIITSYTTDAGGNPNPADVTKLELTFFNQIQKGTGNIILTAGSETYTASVQDAQVNGAVATISISDFAPPLTLQYGTEYKFTVEKGAFVQKGSVDKAKVGNEKTEGSFWTKAQQTYNISIKAANPAFGAPTISATNVDTGATTLQIAPNQKFYLFPHPAEGYKMSWLITMPDSSMGFGNEDPAEVTLNGDALHDGEYIVQYALDLSDFTLKSATGGIASANTLGHPAGANSWEPLSRVSIDTSIGDASFEAMPGETVYLNTFPANGYVFDYWECVQVAGLDGSADPLASFVMPDSGAVTVTPVFKTAPAGEIPVMLVADKPHMGTVSSSSYSVTDGTGVTLAAVANQGYSFVEWQNEGGVQVAATETTSQTITAVSNTFVAVFEATEYNLTISAADGTLGTVIPGGTFQYEMGETVQITAQAENHSMFSHWEIVSGASFPIDLYKSGAEQFFENYFIMPDNDVELKAHFVPRAYEVDVSVSPAAAGTAAGPVGKQNTGSTITLVQQAKDGYVFKEWQATYAWNQPPAINPDNTFTMPQNNVSVTAVFEPIDYTVTVTTDGLGTLSAPLVNPYHAGDTVSLPFTIRPGYEFDKFEVISGKLYADHIQNDAFTMPASDVEIKAHFKLSGNPITITNVGGGNALAYAAIDKDGGGETSIKSAPEGMMITLNAFPQPEYQFQKWEVKAGGVTLSTLTNPRATFVMPNIPVSIEVTFVNRVVSNPNNCRITLLKEGSGAASIKPGSGMAVNAPGVVEYASLQTFTLSNTPDPGWALHGWKVIGKNGVVPLSAEQTQYTLPADLMGDVTVVATFISDTPYNIAVVTEPAGNAGGTAVSGAASAKTEETVQINAMPKANYRFVIWEMLEGGVYIKNPRNPATTFQMLGENVKIQALFELNPNFEYSVTVNVPGGGGTVMPIKGLLKNGEKTAFIVTPDAGWEIDKLELVPGTDAVLSNATDSAELTIGTQNANINATFKKIVYPVSITTDGNGTASVSVNGNNTATTAVVGDKLVFTATPTALGYVFKEWQQLAPDPVTNNLLAFPAITPLNMDMFPGIIELRAVFSPPLKITNVQTQYTYGDSGFQLTWEGELGTGALTFASDNTNAVTVDQITGAVTIVGVGTANITATKAADNDYNMQTATFEITISKAQPVITKVPTAKGIYSGAVLSTSTFSGGVATVAGVTVSGSFEWVDGTVKPPLGTTEYQVIFTPTDSVNYKTATLNVAVSVSTRPSGGGGGVTYYTVTFETNGGSKIDSQRLNYNSKVTKPADPAKEGYTFAGWYSDKELMKEYDFTKEITGNTTVYANWTEKGVPIPDPDQWLEKPFISGYPDGTFKPEADITRAELVQILYNLFGNNETADTALFSGFSDKDNLSAHWASNALSWAVKNGYLKGYDDTSLKPDRTITRAETAAILHRVAINEKLFGEVGLAYFNLSDIDAHWAQADIEALADKGVIQGYPDGTFKPENPVTRAEAVVMISRALGRRAEFTPGKTFSDVDSGHWAYDVIMNAVNGLKKKTS